MISRGTGSILLAAILAAVLGGWLQHRRLAHRPVQASAIVPGMPAPELALKDFDGRTHRLADEHGHRVLLNFWASWCAPCVQEMPRLDAAARAHPDAVVIGVAMDEPVRARAFLAAHPVHYPMRIGEMGPPSTSQRLGDADQVLPYSVLIGADGRVLQVRRGTLDDATLSTWLAPAWH